MKKRVFIVHGWDGSSSEGWFPWLKKELESRGYDVTAPDMPETEAPEINKWIPLLSSLVGVPDEHTYFVGHSIGGNTILRYLESVSPQKVGGAVLVAPYFGNVVLEEGEAETIAEPWLSKPIDFAKVKETAKNIVVILSDNDRWVPVGNKDFFHEALSPKIIVESGKGHFSEGDGVTELPSALQAVLDLSEN